MDGITKCYSRMDPQRRLVLESLDHALGRGAPGRGRKKEGRRVKLAFASVPRCVGRLQATRAGKPLMAYPAIKHLLYHISAL